MPERAPIPSSQEDLKKNLLRQVENAIERMTIEAQFENIDSDDATGLKQYLVRRLTERGQRIFTDHQKELDSLLDEFQNTNFSDRETLVKTFAEKVGDFLNARYAPEDLEMRLRREAAIRENWIEVNESLSYEVKDGEIRLHVPFLFTKKGIGIFKLFEQGLKIIASRLKSDSSLQDIKSVGGYSWIIYEHPTLTKKMGFSIIRLDDDEEEGEATMSREDFLKRYGN